MLTSAGVCWQAKEKEEQPDGVLVVKKKSGENDDADRGQHQNKHAKKEPSASVLGTSSVRSMKARVLKYADARLRVLCFCAC